MKKLFAVLALVAVMTSCKDKKKDEKTPDATTTTTTTDPGTTTTTTTTTTTPAVGGVPTFKDAEVQKFVDDYTAFVTAYVAAYKTKDYTKIADVSKNVAEWGTRSMSIAQKLSTSPEDATAFGNYMTKLSQDITAAMTPQ
jgi:hypothetical protein